MLLLHHHQAILHHPRCPDISPASSISHHAPVSSLIRSPPVTSVQLTLNGISDIMRNTELLSLYVHSLETNFFFPRAESLTPFPSHSDDFPETENGPRPDMPGMLPASRGDPRYFCRVERRTVKLCQVAHEFHRSMWANWLRNL